MESARRLHLVPVCVAAIVAIVALSACGSDKKSSSPTTTTAPETSTSSTTAAPSTTTSSVAPTTTTPTPPSAATTTTAVVDPTAVRIIWFTGPTAPLTCNAPTSMELSWNTVNAKKIELHIDGQLFASFTKPAFDGLQPLACDRKTHTYELIAIGANGTRATQTRTFSTKQS
jgi:hypothetical protein